MHGHMRDPRGHALARQRARHMQAQGIPPTPDLGHPRTEIVQRPDGDLGFVARLEILGCHARLAPG